MRSLPRSLSVGWVKSREFFALQWLSNRKSSFLLTSTFPDDCFYSLWSSVTNDNPSHVVTHLDDQIPSRLNIPEFKRVSDWNFFPLRLPYVAVDCGQPPTLRNGSIVGVNTVFPSVMYLSCHEGFLLRGASQIHCEANGSWSKNSSFCEGNFFMCYPQDL